MLFAPLIYAPHGFTKTSFKKEGETFLDVGCGRRKLPGSIGIDADRGSLADVFHDLESYPWPFEDNSFDLILLSHVLEHLSDTGKTMQELHRIAKPGGRIVIQVPYFRSPDAFTDPTHRHFFTMGSETFIVTSGFKKEAFWVGWPHASKNPLRQAFKWYINAFPKQYENFTSVFFPAECLTWELSAKK